MAGRDWDKELAKIDRQISTSSDDQLLERKSVSAPQGARSAAVTAAPVEGGSPTRWGVLFRVGLAAALAIGVPFWPYASRCGLLLGGYLAAVTVMVVAGGWAAISTWRGRMGRAHVVALLVLAWGAALAAKEVLPRIGYAKDLTRTTWTCQ